MLNLTNKYLVIFFVLILIQNNLSAQTNLHDVVKGEKGRSVSSTTLLPEQQVIFSPADVKQLLGLNSKSELILKESKTDKQGQTHYRFYQTYQNYPIENSMYIMHVMNGKLTGMNGSIILDFGKLKSQPVVSLSPDDAIRAALDNLHASKYAWQDQNMERELKTRTGNLTATYYPVTSFVWYSPGDQIDATTMRLAYKIDVYATEPLSRAYYYVDVLTGKVLGSGDELLFTDVTGTANTAYSGSQTIHSDDDGSGNYSLLDFSRGNGIYTVHAVTGNYYYSTSPDWTLTGADQYALDAHYGVSMTYDFYFTNYGRNSVDDLGLPLINYVNEGIQDNAYWDGAYMHYGVRSVTGNGITAIDITAHELTHGVTQYTNNLLYYLEPGAMNESMSDIMGKSVQFWAKPADVNWGISNDLNWNIRSMNNPKLYYQPNTYHGTYWYSGGMDHGGVHTNSGVGNFMFYLLVTGGSGVNDLGNPYVVSGIGLTAADAIIYRTEVFYLTTLSQYSDWRDACVSAATDLYGAASNEVVQVKNAWYAVGIGTSGMPMCTAGLSAGNITPAAVNYCGSGPATTLTLNGFTNAQEGITIQWKISTNGTTFTNIANAKYATYTTTALSATRYYQCVLTCSAGGTSTSNTVKITISPNVTAGLSIASNPVGVVCNDKKVVFTANPVNGGLAPVYEWKKNGTVVGSGSTFADSVWTNADVVNCVMTSNAACVSGNPASASVTMNVNSCYDTLNLRIFIEGFYVGRDSMIAVIDPANSPLLSDSVVVELHDSNSPYGLVYTSTKILDVHGWGKFIFPQAVFGNQYYVVIRHRNSIETWSKLPVLFDASSVTFDFTR